MEAPGTASAASTSSVHLEKEGEHPDAESRPCRRMTSLQERGRKVEELDEQCDERGSSSMANATCFHVGGEDARTAALHGSEGPVMTRMSPAGSTRVSTDDESVQHSTNEDGQQVDDSSETEKDAGGPATSGAVSCPASASNAIDCDHSSMALMGTKKTASQEPENEEHRASLAVSTTTTTTILGPILRPSPPHPAVAVSPFSSTSHPQERRLYKVNSSPTTTTTTSSSAHADHDDGVHDHDDEVMYHRHRTETPPPPPPPPPPPLPVPQEHDPADFQTLQTAHATSTGALQDIVPRRQKRARNRSSSNNIGGTYDFDDDGRRNPLLATTTAESFPTKRSHATATVSARQIVAARRMGSSSSLAAAPLSTGSSPAVAAWWKWGRRNSKRSIRARRAAAKKVKKKRSTPDSGRSTVLLGSSYDDDDDDDVHDLTTDSDTFEGVGPPIHGRRRGASSPLSLTQPPSFCEEDWTPLDTSYGAALPVGGWIPKTIRRLIECGILAALVGTLVGLVVVTSIKLNASATSISAASGEGDSASNSSGASDDMYINATNATWNWNSSSIDDLAA